METIMKVVGFFNCYIPGDLNGDCVINEEDERILFADCSSWEYSLINGVRAAAIDSINDMWVTSFSGEVHINWLDSPILYSTMPLGMTNARAQTLSAEAADLAGDDLSAWLESSPKKDDTQVYYKWLEFSQARMKAKGGSVSSNNLYNLSIEPK
ncbi:MULTISPECIES: hypothetical protein [Leeuwenhoekiella]|nr:MULTISPECIES: hypothetical protein [Leeuwenhoekiella]HBT11446.1 hypothetical protein [Leeuwenhoekiella sp.]HCW64846.1 hypothetical protein [Leeuwenhoekiella sp.]